MVSRALTLLEVGQVGVVGFGTNVFTAHDLTQPFASHDAGARVLQKFTFKQQGTDICLLLRSIIEQFQLARLQNSISGSEDLWQLALILSDGLVQSSHHARIRPSQTGNGGPHHGCVHRHGRREQEQGGKRSIPQGSQVHLGWRHRGGEISSTRFRSHIT